MSKHTYQSHRKGYTIFGEREFRWIPVWYKSKVHAKAFWCKKCGHKLFHRMRVKGLTLEESLDNLRSKLWRRKRREFMDKTLKELRKIKQPRKKTKAWKREK